MALYAEIWARPGAPTFGRVIDDVPNPFHSFHDGMNVMGEGQMQVPNTFDRFDEILLIDENTPANCVSSLVRIFDDSDPTTPIFEWLPSAILPTTDKFDPNIDISGQGIKSIMEYARVEAYDWDGTPDFAPTFPDWIYGGANVLGNPGFEDQACQPQQYELHITATGGTYTLSDGTDTTSAINHNASDGTIEGRLETDIAAIDDVNVSPIPLASGDTEAFLIEFVDPCLGLSLTVNTGSLTGGSAILTETQEGLLLPSPWTKSQQISSGTPREYGVYDTFQPSQAQAHTGSWSLEIDPGAVNSRIEAFAGAQQVPSVTEGGLYQASIWVYPTAAGQSYRLVIRGIDEDLIARVDVSPPANTWTQVSIADITIPDGESRVIFRFANIDLSGDPATFYVDDAAFREGQAATTVGKIMGDLYDDATSDHAPDRVVWEDGTSGSPYLSLDFTDSVDSNGDAWLHDDIEVKLWMRMTYRQVLDQFSQTYGYEWRVVPNDVEAGTWYLQLYNPGGMQTDYTTSATPGIQGGSSDVRRSVRRFVPDGTHYLVEGLQRLTARDEESDLIAALGRIETSRLSRQLPTEAAVGDAAFEDKTDALVNGLTYSYDLIDPVDIPLVAYKIGDALHIEDPPQVSDNARLIDVECVISPERTVFEVQFSPQTAAGS